MHRSTVLFGATIATMVGLLALAGTADASDTTSGVIKSPTTSYTSPSNATTPVDFFQPGDTVETRCFTEGQTLNGNHIWFKVAADGNSGYVHRDSIVPPSGLAHC